MAYNQRDPHQSFLWTLVRDPTARSISDFFHFHVSRHDIEPTDANFKTFLQRPELVNQQLDYISLEQNQNQTHAINDVLNNYDFIRVTERMEESAVALSMILNIPLLDVLYLTKSKSQGSFDDGRWKHTCFKIKSSTISPKIQAYLNSSEWQTVIYWDQLLHQAAHASLDLTIDKLGRDEFIRNLKQFQSLKAQVMLYCANKVVFPCNASGVPPLPIQDTDCIHGGLGCGFDCMDEYFGNVNTTIVYKEVVNTTVVDKKVLNKTITHKEIVNETVVHMAASAETIVKQAFNSSFGHLVNKCDKARDFDQCCRNVRQGPWWFQTMVRDVPTQHVMAWWHVQKAPHVTSKGEGLQMCAIEKVGIKHWKQLFCVLQTRTERLGGSACIPNSTIPENTPKFVFLRDPLERFLSAFINKCIERGNEDHCEPMLEHVQGLDKQTLFEAYVNSFPVKWNLHFFPQSVYCNGLYRHLDSYDFVGRMGPTFYHYLERLGRQFRGTLPDALEKVFHISDRLNNTNQGIETSASSHVLDYYTPKTLRQVLEYFAIDYVLLDIPIPDWAKQVLEQEGDERKSSQNYDWRIPNKTLRMVNSS